MSIFFDEKGQQRWNCDTLLACPEKHKVVIGGRSWGKSFQIKKLILNDAIAGNPGVVLRWNDVDIMKRRGDKYFKKEPFIPEGKDIIYYSNTWRLINKGETFNSGSDVAYALAVNTAFHDDSTNYPDTNNILFDEFISKSYLDTDLYSKYQRIIGTIVRDRNDVTIWYSGNTLNKFNLLFMEWGINVNDLVKGEINHVITRNGLEVAIDYLPNRITGTITQYTGKDTDNTGDWDETLYPKQIEGVRFNSICKNNTKIPVIFSNGKEHIQLYGGRGVSSPIIACKLINYIPTSTQVIFTPHPVNKKCIQIISLPFTGSGEKYNIIKVILECISNRRVLYDSNYTGDLLQYIVNQLKEK